MHSSSDEVGGTSGADHDDSRIQANLKEHTLSTHSLTNAVLSG